MDCIPDPLAKIARAEPARPFLIAPSWTVTYGEADRRVELVAREFRRVGLGRGDRLALDDSGGLLEPEAVLRDILLLLAAWRTGVVAVPLSDRLPPPAVELLLKGIGGATRVSALGLDSSELVLGTTEQAEVSTWRLDDPATIIFTSGTTGRQKGALHSLANHVWSARGWIERLSLSNEDRWLLDLPLHHVAGLAVLFRCILTGGSVTINDRSTNLDEVLPRLGVTCVSMVSTQLHRALEQDAALARLKVMLLGGGPFPQDMLREALVRGWPVSMSYGLTEMASSVSATPVGGPLEALETAGVVLPHRELALAPDGEIRVRGRTRFAGYATSAGIFRPFDDDGWFSAGDIGAWQDVGGRSMLLIKGRKDNRFISGGENIHPETIEDALLRYPGVEQVVVVPVSDDEFGRRPVAFVDANAWLPDAWKRSLRECLPGYMVPDRFHRWPAQGGSGIKPRRSELARLAEMMR